MVSPRILAVGGMKFDEVRKRNSCDVPNDSDCSTVTVFYMVRLAGIQTYCCEEKEKNLEKSIKLSKIAIDQGANIICFQELFTTHWFPKEINKRHFSYAEKIDGPSIMRMQQLAKENKVVFVCPIFEMEEREGFL